MSIAAQGTNPRQRRLGIDARDDNLRSRFGGNGGPIIDQYLPFIDFGYF